jgi:hypothetical protein
MEMDQDGGDALGGAGGGDEADYDEVDFKICGELGKNRYV